MKIHVVTLSNCIQFILEIKNSNSLSLWSIVLYVGVLFFCRSGLLDLIHTWNKDVGQFYEDRINEQKKLYSERLDITYLQIFLHAFIANHMCTKSSDIEY